MTTQEALEELKRMNDRLIKTFGNNDNESTKALTTAIQVMEASLPRMENNNIITREQFDEMLFHVPDSDLYEVLKPYLTDDKIAISELEEILTSQLPAPAKVNQLMILIENYKAK